MSLTIEALAQELLSEEELALALKLSEVLEDSNYDAVGLLHKVLPKYWVRDGGSVRSLSPRSVYRPFYYVATYAESPHFEEHSRIFIDNVCGHIEGCLHWLVKATVGSERGGLPFGPLVKLLEEAQIVETELADQLMIFNRVVYIPAKHHTVQDFLGLSLDERSFSVQDASFALVLARKLSVQLFDLLRSHGEPIPADWKPFSSAWLTWRRLVSQRPRGWTMFP